MTTSKRYFIWGMGLLGASLGLALKKKGHKVAGCVRSEKNKKYLQDLDFQSIYLTSDSSIWESVHEADGIIIGTPVDVIPEIITSLRENHISNKIWITDMASTKGDLMTWVDQQNEPLLFVGSHPMAGSDLNGPMHAKIELFEQATIYITPAEKMPHHFENDIYASAIEEIKFFWLEVGAIPHQVSYKTHDKWAAYLSHGLHLVSCLVSHLLNDIPEVFDVKSTPAGGSFRDITRVAGSNPELWDGIIMSNSKEVKEYLKSMEALLKNWIFALEKGVLPVEEIFKQSAEIRSKIIKERAI